MTDINTSVIKTYHIINGVEDKTKLNEEYFQLNGKKEGIYKKYYKNGHLECEVNFVDGVKNGIYRTYYNRWRKN